MYEAIIKISCLALILGLCLSLLRENGVKSYARIGLGLVFSVFIIGLIPTAFGNYFGSGGTGLTEALSGKLQNILILSEIKGDYSSDNALSVTEEYKSRLKQGAESAVAEKTGFLTNVTFVVCEDISSADFGMIEHVHCQIIGFEEAEGNNTDAGIYSTSKPEADGGIDKIEITPDGIFINGEPIGDNDSSNENDISANIADREMAEEKIYIALQSFCGVAREKCSIFWEE